jgi:mono/diheme cytochrome c family protein
MSSSIRLIQVAALALAVISLPQRGQAADPDNGSRLAHRWCEACHVVTPTQTRASTDLAPPFASIAKRPDFDAAKIALFLLDPHPKMPDMALTRNEAGDLAAFIGTLK